MTNLVWPAPGPRRARCSRGGPTSVCFLQKGRFGTGKSTSAPSGEAPVGDPSACATQIRMAALSPAKNETVPLCCFKNQSEEVAECFRDLSRHVLCSFCG